MGSGGSQTLWPPSNEASVRFGFIDACTLQDLSFHLTTRLGLCPGLSLMVGLIKRE